MEETRPTHARTHARTCTHGRVLTNVYEVTLAVQHDVAVVSVFDLQQEEQQAVCRHAADEVVARLRPARGGDGDSVSRQTRRIQGQNNCV